MSRAPFPAAWTGAGRNKGADEIIPARLRRYARTGLAMPKNSSCHCTSAGVSG